MFNLFYGNFPNTNSTFQFIYIFNNVCSVISNFITSFILVFIIRFLDEVLPLIKLNVRDTYSKLKLQHSNTDSSYEDSLNCAMVAAAYDVNNNNNNNKLIN
jgi:hypothetical protein